LHRREHRLWKKNVYEKRPGKETHVYKKKSIHEMYNMKRDVFIWKKPVKETYISGRKRYIKETYHMKRGASYEKRSIQER